MGKKSKIINMEGQKYGKWNVLGEHRSVNGRTEWLCRCDCGRTEAYIWRQNLISGKSKQCRKCSDDLHKGEQRAKNDLTGRKFGKLYVIKRGENAKSGAVRYLCECECGNTQLVEYGDLTREKVKMCTQCSNQLRGTHRMSHTKFHNSWRGMKERCSNPSHTHYTSYGGRGIKVCSEWEDFENFKNDMYDSYLEHVKEFGEDNTSRDRIDVNKGYYKDNCRWATNKIQANNRTDNVFINYNGETNTLFEMLKKYNIEYYKYYYLKDKYPNIDKDILFETAMKGDTIINE